MIDMLDKFKSWFFKPIQHIQVRYNQKCGNSPLVWRVIINGEEHLASHVEIHGWVYSESSMVEGERKMNLACKGRVKWYNTQIVIMANPKYDTSEV